MPVTDLSQIECFLYDPEPNVRRLMRDALVPFKIGDVEQFGSVAALRSALQGAAPDLLILDVADAEDETLHLVHRLRHGRLGTNPFAGVIMTAFNPTHQLLNRVTNCGADALLVKPIAPRHLHERISALAEAERAFVVTSDFIGPDRRKAPRAGSRILPVPVPNTLRLKMQAGQDEIEALVAEAAATINGHKLERLAFQAAFLVEFARPGLSEGPPDRMSLDHLLRVPAVVDELLRRLPLPPEGGEHPAAVKARVLLAEVGAVSADLAAGVPAPGLSDLIMRALDVMASLGSGRSRADMAAEVAEAVDTYRNRLELAAQQRFGAAATP
jgi:DNA-binding response OmpR family regulator